MHGGEIHVTLLFWLKKRVVYRDVGEDLPGRGSRKYKSSEVGVNLVFREAAGMSEWLELRE